jgi:hypothetical protein
VEQLEDVPIGALVLVDRHPSVPLSVMPLRLWVASTKPEAARRRGKV